MNNDLYNMGFTIGLGPILSTPTQYRVCVPNNLIPIFENIFSELEVIRETDRNKSYLIPICRNSFFVIRTLGF